MLDSERELVNDTVDREGFDYTFRLYSNFKIVRDKKFHELRKDYIKSANRLSKYLGLLEETTD